MRLQLEQGVENERIYGEENGKRSSLGEAPSPFPPIDVLFRSTG